MPSDDDLTEQFNTPYLPAYEPPPSFQDPRRFQLRNDYPLEVEEEEDGQYPWLSINFKEEPKQYMEELLKYCFEGMPECDFVVNENEKRDWWHAPWMHYHAAGREPIHGLTYERATPPKELASTQTSWLQTWAVGFYNQPGATVFGQVWENPASPDWSKDVSFPYGSVAFKLLMTDATNHELQFIKGSPMWTAFTAQQPDEAKEPIPGHRNTAPSTVRLLQVDIAARDERADSETAWTFGTFVYDGRGLPDHTTLPFPDPGWRRLLPIGLMWGNDPELTQENFDEKGNRPVQHWINSAADELFRQLRSDRPFWGWNGRMNGPADDFISACLSCHSVAQKITAQELDDINQNEFTILVPPKPTQDRKGQWKPEDDKKTMNWFRNLKDTRFDDSRDSPNGDYSLQLMMGYLNYDRYMMGKPPLQSAPRSGHL